MSKLDEIEKTFHRCISQIKEAAGEEFYEDADAQEYLDGLKLISVIRKQQEVIEKKDEKIEVAQICISGKSDKFECDSAYDVLDEALSLTVDVEKELE